jgi:hypothetical protein
MTLGFSLGFNMPKPDGYYLAPEWWERKPVLEMLIDAGAEVWLLADECEDLFQLHPCLPKTLTRTQLMLRVLKSLGLETKRMKERRLYVKRVEKQQREGAA